MKMLIRNDDEMKMVTFNLGDFSKGTCYSVNRREKKKNPSVLYRTHTYDPPTSTSAALPLNCKRLVVSKLFKRGPQW